VGFVSEGRVFEGAVRDRCILCSGGKGVEVGDVEDWRDGLAGGNGDEAVSGEVREDVLDADACEDRVGVWMIVSGLYYS
jgi:hypothetical protein